jgi:hypothetical protein
MSDLYDLYLFHFKVRRISLSVYRQKAVNFNEHLKSFTKRFVLNFTIK